MPDQTDDSANVVLEAVSNSSYEEKYLLTDMLIKAKMAVKRFIISEYGGLAENDTIYVELNCKPSNMKGVYDCELTLNWYQLCYEFAGRFGFEGGYEIFTKKHIVANNLMKFDTNFRDKISSYLEEVSRGRYTVVGFGENCTADYDYTGLKCRVIYKTTFRIMNRGRL